MSPAAPTDAPATVRSRLATGLGVGTVVGAALAGVRRRAEVAAERDGRLVRLGPDTIVDQPQGRLARAIGTWDPAPPRTPTMAALARAWAAPATVVGLLLARVAGADVRFEPRLGAWVAADMSGPSAAALRAAGLGANTLGHTVLSLTSPSQRLLDHEVAHVRQFERLGMGLYPLYLWLSVRHGYRRNPLEVAARRGAARRGAARGGRLRLGPQPPTGH